MAETSKELEVRPHGSTMYFVLRWKGGGEVPKELSGLYTNADIAQQAADAYLTSRPAKRTTRKTESA